MARHKFEKEFSRKLQEREITPSENSWEKLQAKLETADKKKKSGFSLKWMGIAASFVGGLFILSLAFNSDGIQETHEMVDAPSEEIQLEEQNQVFEQVEVASEEIQEEEKEQPREIEKEVVKEKIAVPENTAVAAVEVKEENKEQEELQAEPELEISQEQIAGKLGEVVAEISSEERGEDMTDAEVDELLRKAATEITVQKAVAETRNVDEGSLLYEVEMELERSFREKVFNVLKESYLKTKTAVANRSF